MELIKLTLILFSNILLIVLSDAIKTEGFCNSDCVDTYFPGEYLQRWMSALKDDIPIRSLNIPGAHDSGAYIKGQGGWTKVQELKINQLLQLGVRYLDIRCRHINNKFRVHHDKYYLNLNFDDVLNMVSKFLDKNPSETVLMRVRVPEYNDLGNNRSYSDTMNEYINKFKAYFWLFKPNSNLTSFGNSSFMDISTFWATFWGNPKLGETRGKIVILQNFPSKVRFGLDLGSFALQDDYSVALPSMKWYNVKQMIENKISSSIGKMNHLSGNGLLTPLLIALYVNDRMLKFMNGNHRDYFGIIPADFPTFKLLNAIAYANCYNKKIFRDQSEPNIDWKSTNFIWSQMFGTSNSGEAVYLEDKQPTDLMSVRKTLVYTNSKLVSIQLLLSDGLSLYYTDKHGSDGGILYEYNVPKGEVITEIELYLDSDQQIESIIFITDKGSRSKSCGNKSLFGVMHRVTFPNCGQLIGLASRSSSRIEELKFMTMSRNYVY